jgi:HAD superfamily phosphatase
MMTQNGFDRTRWLKESATPPAPIDTIIFDVDGVLWDTGDSFDTAVQQTVDYFFVRHFHHSHPRPVTTEELRAFRRAGGLNNDWDMTYTLIATRLARIDDVERAAAASGGRGRAWAQTLLPAGIEIDYEQIVRVFDEIYWGAADFLRCFGEDPRYVADAPGCWHREEQLLPHTLLDDLRSLGIHHFGIATGRSRFELATVLESSQLEQHIPIEAMLTGDVLAKPDGRVLDRVLGSLDGLAAQGGRAQPGATLFCGDTKDDLDAVLNYRALKGNDARWIGAVAVVRPEEEEFFRRTGSDAVINHVADLPALIQRFNSKIND